MRKPSMPMVKLWIPVKSFWPGSPLSGPSAIPIFTMTTGREVITIPIRTSAEGPKSKPGLRALAEALKMARHLVYIHNQVVEAKVKNDRTLRTAARKLKQQGA